MTKEEMQERYKSLILPENKHPYHFERVAGDEVIQAYNPMCGDKYQLSITGDDVLIEGYFHGFGCAISKASTSLLLREVEGKSKNEVIKFCEEFIAAVESGEAPPHFSRELKVLVQLKDFEGRVDCIQLSWKALLAHLAK